MNAVLKRIREMEGIKPREKAVPDPVVPVVPVVAPVTPRVSSAPRFPVNRQDIYPYIDSIYDKIRKDRAARDYTDGTARDHTKYTNDLIDIHKEFSEKANKENFNINKIFSKNDN